MPRSNRSRGGRLPFDHVVKFKVPILQAMPSLPDERCEYRIENRLSLMRFLGPELAGAVLDANTIGIFRNASARATISGEPAAAALFKRFDALVKACGDLAMRGQITDAAIVAAPEQRSTKAEKQAI